MLKPGGFMIHTTRLLNPIHGYPSDLWPLTPRAWTCSSRARPSWLRLLAVLMIHFGMQSVRIPEVRWLGLLSIQRAKRHGIAPTSGLADHFIRFAPIRERSSFLR